MITKIKIKYKKTFVFNERGNTNPDGFIYVNTYNLSDASDIVKRATNKSVVLVDCYPLRKKGTRHYNAVPAWAI